MNVRARDDSLIKSRRLFAVVTISVVVALAMAEGFQYYYQQEARFNRHDPLSTVLAQILVPWCILGALVPLIVLVVRWIPIERRRLWAIPVHLVGSVAFAVLHLTLLSLLHFLLDPPNTYPLYWRVTGLMREYTFQDMVVYWGIVGTLHAVRYHRQAIVRERESLALRETLSEARLMALRGQLHPHFLFNSLNTVAMLVRNGDRDQAIAMLVGVSDLLRELLRDAPAAGSVALREEIDFTTRYLALERMRFGERLTVVVDVPDEVALARVPSLLLQPLVENALRHGVGHVSGDARIEVVARKRDTQLNVEVRDNGPGVSSDWKSKSTGGIGVRNTISRLEQLYGSAFAFTLEALPGGGAMSRVTLPFEAEARP